MNDTAIETFVFEHASTRLRCEGVAERIVVPGGPDRAARASASVARALAGHPDGAIAVGALPFDEDRPAVLVVPERTVAAPPPSVAASPGSAPRVTAVPAREGYARAVAAATDAIRDGALRKVVLARMLVVQSESPLDAEVVLDRLREAEPDAYIFAAQGFVGATPELLVARHGTRVTSRPLAGTARRGSTPQESAAAAAALLMSDKDVAEHGFVADAIIEALRPLCTSLHAVGPEPVATGALWHLGTRLDGTLRDPAPTALEIAGALHPAPAVCGTPTADARAFIAAHEGFDRTLYTGLVGWQDAHGDGEWAIALRCAEVRDRIATLFAGAGIVTGSDPDAELAETDAKFAVMLRALGLPT